MRAVVQRVTRARVTVSGEVVSEIGAGLCALVGIARTDGPEQARTIARKLHELRILDGDASASDLDVPILVVSQFTLYGDTSRGRRPSWIAAAPAADAEPLMSLVADELRRRGARVQTGRFGAHMHLELVNDGPVTILLEV